MLPSSISCLLAGALFSLAAAQNDASGHIYTLNPSSSQPALRQYPAVDQNIAKLILAQSAGVSRFYGLPDDEEALSTINAFAGPRWPLFSASRQRDEISKAVLWLDGDLATNQAVLVNLADIPKVPISTSIGSSDVGQLLNELHSHGISISSNANLANPVHQFFRRFSRKVSLETGISVDLLSSGGSDILYFKTTSEWKDNSLPPFFEQVRKFVDEGKLAATIVVMDTTAAKDTRHKYETFALSKRYSQTSKYPSEEPLAPSHPSQSADAESSEETLQVGFSETKEPSTPLASLPRHFSACFGSQEACEKNTNNCTQHGECMESTRGGRSCFSCQCKPTVRKEGNLKKTTVWAGNACQKIDLVQPFWLLAGVTLFIVSIIAWAISLLYTMGDMELPSVIGAGVSGPRAK